MASDPEAVPTVVPSALPSGRARLLAVASVLVAGACGGLIGRAFIENQCSGDCTTWEGLGLVIGALVAAVGVAIVAVLALRAMDEWQATTDEGRRALDALPEDPR